MIAGIGRLRSGMVGNTGLLIASGSAVQFLNLLAYPLLSRFYTPADFGILASVTAIATLLGAVICLRLDAVIQIAEPEEEADILTAALILGASLSCLTFALGLGGALTAGVMGRGETVLGALPPPCLASIIAAIALMNGFFLLGRQYAAKRLSYRRISLAQFGRTLAGIAAQIAFFFILPGPAGLVLGFSAGLLLAMALLWPLGAAELRRLLTAPAVAVTRLSTVLTHYRHLIFIDAVNVLISVAALMLFPVIIVSLYGPSEAGFFAVASRLAFIPAEVVGASIATVYFQRLSKALRAGHAVARLYARTLSLGIVAALAIAATLALIVDPFVALVFDDGWSRTSLLVLYLLPTAIARFHIVCIGITPVALKKPRIVFFWNLAQLIIIFGAAVWAKGRALEAFLLVSGLGLLVASAVYAAYMFRLTHRISAK